MQKYRNVWGGRAIPLDMAKTARSAQEQTKADLMVHTWNVRTVKQRSRFRVLHHGAQSVAATYATRACPAICVAPKRIDSVRLVAHAPSPGTHACMGARQLPARPCGVPPKTAGTAHMPLRPTRPGGSALLHGSIGRELPEGEQCALLPRVGAHACWERTRPVTRIDAGRSVACSVSAGPPEAPWPARRALDVHGRGCLRT